MMDETLIRLGLIDDEDIIIDDAALSIALLDHTGTDLLPYRQLLDAIATRLDATGFEAASDLQRAEVLSHVLAQEFEFIGDRDTYDDPANADLISVLDRRRGLPISLSILYVATARRLGWAADVLDLPGHALVLVGQDATPTIIDPFRGGLIVEPDQLGTLLSAAAGSQTASRIVSAMPNRAVLIRLLLNQATRAEQNGKGRRALELYRRMTTFAPEYGHAWWERARLELVDHNVVAGRTSLAAMLEVTKAPDLRRKIKEMLKALALT